MTGLSVQRWRGLLLAAAMVAAAMPAVAQSGLEAALQAALSRHPAVAGKRAEVEASAAGGEAARSQRFPTLSAQWQRYDAGSTLPGTSASPGVLRARQPLWAFGRIDRTIALADADTAVQRADLLRVRRQLLQDTAVAYAQVLSARERLRLAHDNAQVLGRLHEQIQRRERGQLASRADVTLAAGRLAQAQAREQGFAGDLEVALHDLLALTQVPVAADQPVPPAFTQLPPVGALLAQAQERSADVQYKQMLVDRAGAAVEQARTAGMPTVYLQAERDHGQSVLPAETRVSVVLEGALEGMGMATRARTRAAASQATAAAADLESTRNEITRTVNRLESGRQAQQRLVALNGRALQDVQQLFASYQRQYEAGTRSWLDLLNIQRELSDQALQQAQAESDWIVLSLQLAALGGQLDGFAGLGEE